MNSSNIPLRRSARLAAKNQKMNPVSIPGSPSVITPQEEHIKVSKLIKRLRKIMPNDDSYFSEHKEFVKDLLNKISNLNYKNTKIRLTTELFSYLQSFGRDLLEVKRFQNSVKNKISELEKEISKIPDENRYKRNFCVSMDQVLIRIKQYS